MNTEFRLILAAAAGLLAGTGCAGSPSPSDQTAADSAAAPVTGAADPSSMPSGEAHQCSADHGCNGKMKMDGGAQPSASSSQPPQKP